MNKFKPSPMIAAIGFSTAIGMTGLMYANAQTPDSGTAQTTTQSAQDTSKSAPSALTPGTANPMPATRQAEGTAADRTPPGQTQVRGTAASQAPAQATAQDSEQREQSEKQRSAASDSTAPTTADPIPATRQVEGTAADTTVPGATPVRGAAAAQAPQKPTAQRGASRVDHSADRSTEDQANQSSPSAPTSANPMPATRVSEGTAADTTQPRETTVRGTGASRAPSEATSRVATADRAAQQGARRGSTMIGAAVKDAQGQQAGTVQDIIVDPNSGRVTHAVVSQSDASQSLVVIPWRTVQSMHKGGAMVVDRDRLASAPKFNASQWPDLSRADWSQQADQHWSAPMSGIAETNQREHGTHSR